MEYIVVKNGVAEKFPSRPTQDHLKWWGVGRYVFRKLDGQVSRIQNVVVNRNGNLKVVVESPGELESLSLHHLERLAKTYEKVVKSWPSREREAKKVLAEIQLRQEIQDSAIVNYSEGDEPSDEWWAAAHFGGAS